ncbi:hypothetical protein KORDIASMS9_01491 [Kordia sp. SMS9]|uniref:hypothetical protein n=1 Tax=Kordia sp. SMS9 TaxID=2282170 RepID=UPI000E0D029B|nr:hypothetical protein [Kordia sp. SMS9]AXG69271.1 hypothetical protein KORDIASMS9_01491 [Kordia sp. SMS9]
MKYLLVLFSITLFAKGCNDKNPDEETLKNAQDKISIQYEASTRGFYQKINLTKELFSLTKIRGGKVSVQQEVSEEDWNEIVTLLDKIDAEKLKKNYMNADDVGRDAVIPAILQISYKENVVTNVEFGHGNPPKALAALMTKIEAMANAVDKP